MSIQNNKPELLLPAGNVEAFFAAIEGGADAVYTGFRKFNARQRAANFNELQLSSLIHKAKEENVKVFITLNVVIKNEEIPDLLDALHILQQLKPDAVIIQDWGVYFLMKQFFPDLTIHASTQMAIHNSLGVSFANKLGMERSILARELTQNEMEQIAKKTETELECFVHGALCYSFSGMCLFSSFLGGAGANRGQCAQPCRRQFMSQEGRKYVFSLKDNELIDFVPDLIKAGVTCFKIEGRMKPAEYVYNVARAYRMAIDSPENIPEAKKILATDLGRQKTSWFFGGNISESLSQKPYTGLFLGNVESIDKNGFSFSSKHELIKGNRVRIHGQDDKSRESIKISDFDKENNSYHIPINTQNIQVGDAVILASPRIKNFPDKFKMKGKYVDLKLKQKDKTVIQKSFFPSEQIKAAIFVRIDSINWLKKIWLKEIDGVFLQFSKTEWKAFDFSAPFLQKNRNKIWIELPKFISETEIDFYENLCKKAAKNNYTNFVISHISQKLIIPKKSHIICNENVYVFHDATAAFLTRQTIQSFVYPLENDMENLQSMQYKNGIICMYGHPQLFFSRMPVKSANTFQDDNQIDFRKTVIDGVTIVTPEIPVSWLQYAKSLRAKGFNRFLIDLSFEKPSQNLFNKLLKRLHFSEQVQPSSNFNFKKGLK